MATLRTDVPQPPMWQTDERYTKALELAIYFQNRCCELTEIIEMFIRDAEAEQGETPC